MKLSFYIAKRYLFSKKSHNAINIISAISVCGIAFASLALVCTLSVFNGFHDLMESLFTAFDPELKISAASGKVFDVNDPRIVPIKSWSEVAVFSASLEDNVMVQYKDRQTMATIKGVEENYEQLTTIDSIFYGKGDPCLHTEHFDYALPGMGLVSTLGSGVRFVDPLTIYAPIRDAKISMNNPATAFRKAKLYSSGLAFMVNQEQYDNTYLLAPLPFVQKLFDYDTQVSAVNLRLSEGCDVDKTRKRIADTLGTGFVVHDRFEQQAETFNVMKIEKLFSYLFLSFILFIACFNVISSISMLVLEKRDDINTLHDMGASDQLISRIFLFEGWIISFLGAVVGIVLGVVLCLLQQHLGLVSMGSDFIVDAYPVSIRTWDVICVFVTVLVVGLMAVWIPIHRLRNSLLSFNK
ncbi:MAG: FtsX-like permease family protein [Bacteroidales bacterium]|nr:FtsX-like permease family protein [Bacteroidales bacterium]